MISDTLWNRCVSFHGHACPGLAIGVRGADIALDFFEDDITDEDNYGIRCTVSTDKCPSDGIRCVLNIDENSGLTVKPAEGPVTMDFSLNGKHIILILKTQDREISREENIIRILKSPADNVFEIKTRY